MGIADRRIRCGARPATVQGTFKLSDCHYINYKNPKSLKVGYWETNLAPSHAQSNAGGRSCQIFLRN